jgi:hypothetical protein
MWRFSGFSGKIIELLLVDCPASHGEGNGWVGKIQENQPKCLLSMQKRLNDVLVPGGLEVADLPLMTGNGTCF